MEAKHAAGIESMTLERQLNMMTSGRARLEEMESMIANLNEKVTATKQEVITLESSLNSHHLSSNTTSEELMQYAESASQLSTLNKELATDEAHFHELKEHEENLVKHILDDHAPNDRQTT